ncbi:MAG: S8 family serine peptidase [Actinomycetota bacterium]|nr:S8 family serine peptidase [Actinomycetota bacterium]
MRSRARLRILASFGAAACLLASVAVPSSASLESRGFYVVSFDGRITDTMHAALEATGAEIVGYEPDDSYVVWAGARELRRSRSVPSVRHVRRISAGDKIGIDRASVRGHTVSLITHSSNVDVLARAVDPMVNVTDTSRIDEQLSLVAGTISTSDISAIARRPDVLFIEPVSTGFRTEDEKTTQTLAGNLDDERRAVPGYREWLDKMNLSGKGVTVAIVDTGINESHPDLAGRVVKTIDYGTLPVSEASHDTGGHGTHVAGIVAGSPVNSGLTYEDPDGFLYGMGVAPGVQLVNQNYLGLFAEAPGGESDTHEQLRVLTKDAYNAGARMWNASWTTGEGERAGYLASVRVLDQLSRDALPKTTASEDFLFVFSAGNSGARGATSPKEAKNIIAVGSTASGRGPHWPLESDPDMVSSFSSQGPTSDGRIFPTVSAPGGTVISARSPFVPACTSPVDGTRYYCAFSGTSMAAPHVTGAAALIHQDWKRSGERPSPAMVKALLVNSATDIGTPDIPNNFEGWGRVNLANLFGANDYAYVDQWLPFARVREADSREVFVEGKRPLKVTLAWSDAAARVGAKKALVNDLDLVVERLVDGRVVETYRGNVFRKGQSMQGGKADRLNNLENVFVMTPERGYYRIKVVVANLPGDGIPNNSDATDQDFALVMTGVELLRRTH